MKNILIALLLLCSLSAQAQFQNLVKATVSSVHDGDGCVVKFDGQAVKTTVRFRRIDAPEIRGYSVVSQPYGRNAGDTLREMIKGKVVLLDTMPGKGSSRDKYGRLLADIYTADTVSIQFLMVSKGLAWYAKRDDDPNPKFNTVLYRAEKAARAEEVGLWGSYLTKKGKKARVYTPWWWRKNYSLR